jgi:hypothetical protein
LISKKSLKPLGQKNQNLVGRSSINLYREPSIDAFYQISVHLGKQFQERRYIEIDQSETIIASGGHVCYGLISKKSLKPLGQKNQNLVGRSSIKIAHFVLIC